MREFGQWTHFVIEGEGIEETLCANISETPTPC
jgi:hypothetical protein